MKKVPRRILAVTKKDFDIQTFRAGGVRITHRDSGAHGVAQEHRTEKRNREAAFSRLVVTKVFQTWLRVETERKLENQHDFRRRLNRDVERQMIPRLLRVEIKRDGRWIHDEDI